MSMNFFNQSHWAVSKLTNNVSIIVDVPFAFDVHVIDALKLTKPDTVVAKMLKVSGRDKTELTDAIVITNTSGNIYNVSGVVQAGSWNGTDSLVLQVVINEVSTIVVPMVGTV